MLESHLRNSASHRVFKSDYGIKSNISTFNQMVLWISFLLSQTEVSNPQLLIEVINVGRKAGLAMLIFLTRQIKNFHLADA